MVKYSRPRRGSLAFLPRGRASRLLPRVKYWPPYEGNPKLLGFIGYKAGHLTVYYVEMAPNSPTQGQEVAKVSTLIAAPPMTIAGIATFGEENKCLKELARVWSANLPENIYRKTPTWRPNESEGLKKLEALRGDMVEVRVIGLSIPKNAGLSKKNPDLLEIKVGGEVDKALDYAISKLGKQVSIEEAFKPGDLVDVIGVTKGRGFQGVVKRWGTTILPRKKRKGRRVVGAIGGRIPHYVPYTVPRPGQLGYHRRTEFNKRVLLIEKDGAKLTPKGGIPHFGVIKSECMVLEGTAPGALKRPIVLRTPARPPRIEIEPPQVLYAGIPR